MTLIEPEKLVTLLAMAAGVKLGVGSLLPLVPKAKGADGARPPLRWRTSVGTALALGAGILIGRLFGEPQLGLVSAWIASGSHDFPDLIAHLLGIRKAPAPPNTG